MEKTNAPKQLKMILFPKDKTPYGLPDGYTISHYSGTRADVEAWLEICRNGLVSDAADEKTFRDFILRTEIDPLEDCLFLERDGKKVATVTAVKNDGRGMGYIHMVSVLASERGKGLGRALVRIAETELYRAGVPIAYLTTDDFRKAACRSYLSAGFYPVNYDTDMPGRWRAILREFGISSVQMLKNNGEPDRILEADGNE